MPDDLYYHDVVTWSARQAELLRRARAGERPNDLDWDNIIEEIETLGRSEVQSVGSLLLQAALHLMKLRAWPNSSARRKWLADADDFMKQARRLYRPSMARLIDLPTVHADALARVPYRRFVEPPLPVPANGCIPLAAAADPEFTLEQFEASLFPPG
jgi:hypothetical protein